MKKQTLLLFLLFATAAFAQKGSWGEFPLIPTKTSAARKASANKIKGTPAYEKALRVYERLREARGDYRYPVPTFYLTQKETVAEMNYSENAIYLGEKAFHVCESFGPQSEAAIAFLLGHELTHYYEKHAWKDNFAVENKSLNLSTQIDALYRDMLETAGTPELRTKLLRFDSLSRQIEGASMELQSDYLGGFLAYSAGYGAFDQGDELIRRLYREFGLPDNLPGYISRNEREEMSRRSALKMKDLADIFEMANLLSAAEEYESAYRYYRKVLVEYQSRELYNNVGAAAMMHAMKKYMNANELKFRYPIQIDLEMASSRGPQEDSIRIQLLRQAIQHFDAAISLDPNYAPAYLNKACALALLGDRTRAFYFADVEARSASKGAYANNLDKVEILLGILDAGLNTPEGTAKAQAHFKSAAATDLSGLAAYNMAVLNGTPLPAAPPDPGSNKFFDEESIDGQEVSSMLYPEDDKMLPIDELFTFYENTRQSKNSRLYFNRLSGNLNILFLSTVSGYTGATARGVKIGQKRADIENKYGLAARTILTPTGSIMAYPDILFMLQGEVMESWVLVKK
ncbi:MAG: hypothetical protein JNM22_12225 [Saprospiraceae bacterium]|nr:hypothetical protein [Saprospiraceae bacterium]